MQLLKVYQGPLICGLPFAVPLLLKGTATPNKLLNILYLAESGNGIIILA